jgi:hypothetical protein
MIGEAMFKYDKTKVKLFEIFVEDVEMQELLNKDENLQRIKRLEK